MELYELAKETVGFQWYNNTDSLGQVTEGSEHGLPYYRTRFDENAANKGNMCASCHSQEGSIDYVLLNMVYTK
ncbi:MAG TPA: hypothetical protein ENI20_07840 [Bacteroides sp.]|nr:hypothetical protein [Bacteroides sp.]